MFCPCKKIQKRGVMTGGTLNNAKVNRIEPPGIISYETIDVIIARMDETLTEVAHEFSLNSGPSAAGQPSPIFENYGLGLPPAGI
jgi:putrescine aminotransferase